jgi:predicted transcriptional regulator
MSAGKAMSVRLPPGLAAELAALARVEDVSPSELVRAAIQHFIATRPSDPEFKERLRKRLEEDAEILKRFSD